MPNEYPLPKKSYYHLLDAAKQDGLVVFIGAGLNADKHLLWSDLLRKLLGEAMDYAMFSHLDEADKTDLNKWIFSPCGLNHYEIAELTKFAFGEGNIKKLKRFLYDCPNGDGLMLKAAAELCAKKCVHAVVN